MNITGSDHPEDVNEAELANLKMVPSRVVKPPRVERSPIALECIYNKTVDLVQANGKKSINSLVIGEVVNIHIDDAVITDGNIDMARIRPIARLGYMDYTSVDNIFTMHRVPVR
jgi:flavin reductase (DIM6/NTAB) family NADH-FMN oxidoreductase RutF